MVVPTPTVGTGLSLTFEYDVTRFWVQDWVQLNEGRMAFPVRKRRQIGHLAFLLLWLRTRRSGVRVPPGAPVLRKNSMGDIDPSFECSAFAVCTLVFHSSGPRREVASSSTQSSSV